MIHVLGLVVNGYSPSTSFPEISGTRRTAVLSDHIMPWAVSTDAVIPRVLGAAAALTFSISPMSAAVTSAELTLNDFGSDSLVTEGLKSAGMDGDIRMIKLWTRLKVGALEAEGKKAADSVSNEKALANARMRVRSIQPYLDAAQNDIFTYKWKFVQGYLGVIFSQRDAFQTIVTETYPGGDPVSLASKDALVSEGNNIIRDAELLAAAAQAGSESQALAAYAKLSLSYDRFLKAGDLYGNSQLLPSGKRATPRTVEMQPKGLDALAAKKLVTTVVVKKDAAEVAAAQAKLELEREGNAKAKAEAAAKAAEKAADKAEAESEKADREVEKAAAERKMATEAIALEKAAAKEQAAQELAAAKEAAEQEAERKEAEQKKALQAAEDRLQAASAAVQELRDREAAASSTLRLYEKALDYEVKQEAAAQKLARKSDSTGGLVPQYDPVTSTEMLYKGTPQSALQYDETTKPRIKDSIVVIAGPDKGRVGTLLGIDQGSAIIKLSTRELKIIDLQKIAKQLSVKQ